MTSSGDDGTSVTGMTEDFYPPPLWALEERPCSSCARKKMLREKWEAARGLDSLACPRRSESVYPPLNPRVPRRIRRDPDSSSLCSDDGVPSSSPSAPVQGPGTELQDPLAPPATWWCDPCEQHKKSLRDWRLRRSESIHPRPDLSSPPRIPVGLTLALSAGRASSPRHPRRPRHRGCRFTLGYQCLVALSRY